MPVQIAAARGIRPLRSRRRRKVGLIDSARATSLTLMAHAQRMAGCGTLANPWTESVTALGLPGGGYLSGDFLRRARIRASSFGEFVPRREGSGAFNPMASTRRLNSSLEILPTTPKRQSKR